MYTYVPITWARVTKTLVVTASYGLIQCIRCTRTSLCRRQRYRQPEASILLAILLEVGSILDTKETTSSPDIILTNDTFQSS